MSGRLYVGMRGVFATVSIDFGPLQGIDWSTATKSLVLTIEGDHHDLTLTSWTWAATQTGARATYIPDGTEFTEADEIVIAGTATINGHPLDLVPWRERIYATK
jgi:hypothetical protein